MMDPTKFVCGNCEHGHAPDGRLECWRHPPAVASQAIVTGASVISPAQPGGSIQWLVKAVRPPVRAGDTCGEFELRADVVN